MEKDIGEILSLKRFNTWIKTDWLYGNQSLLRETTYINIFSW